MYYGWPLIEAVLALLPTPSPKSIKISLSKWFRALKSRLADFTALMNQSTESISRPTSGY